jgi:Arc/MetJ-type ribon-helix-helix transcriptional regulator
MARDFLFGGLEHWVRNTVGRGRRNDPTAVAREMVRLLLDGWAAQPAAKAAAAPWQGLEARIARLEGRLKPAARIKERGNEAAVSK